MSVVPSVCRVCSAPAHWSCARCGRALCREHHHVALGDIADHVLCPACECVVSTAVRGLILAEALGLRRVPADHAAMMDVLTLEGVPMPELLEFDGQTCVFDAAPHLSRHIPFALYVKRAMDQICPEIEHSL